ncbi:putative holin [Duganella sp. CY15W]|uniref:putative holin n=1 Tax=Duganella sp. CY15W TaxID=2692172 RepID=UPI0019261D39|nr:putative holin [Duganella sp. CY15W]
MKFLPWFCLCLTVCLAWHFRNLVAAVRGFITDRLPRMFEWLLVAILTCALAFLLSPQQLPVSVYKISLIAVAGCMGYWLDRSLFPYARPDAFLGSEIERESGVGEPLCFELDYEPPNDLVFCVSMLRRAVIVAAAMIAVGLGA